MNFAPDLKPYSGIGKLRFWCQKVLPLVYDDSLSYYELLNKVVWYLNNTIQDVANCEDNVSALNDAFVQLQEFVNAIVDDLEPIVERQINEMIESGEFEQIVTDTLGYIIAKPYDTTKQYVLYDYVLYNGKLYRAKGSTSGNFDPTKWDETTVGEDGTILERYTYITLTNNLNDLYKLRAMLGAKNVLPYPYDDTPRTMGGITITVNDDGSITLDGTRTTTGTEYFNLSDKDFGEYTLRSSEPVNPLAPYKVYLFGNSENVRLTYNGVNHVTSLDIFEDASFTNETVYPMIVPQEETQTDEYAEYGKTNVELTKDIKAIRDALERIIFTRARQGATNYIPANSLESGSVFNGLTLTPMPNGELQVSGTTTVSGLMGINTSPFIVLPNGKYTCTLGKEYPLRIAGYDNTWEEVASSGNTAVSEITFEATSEYTMYQVQVRLPLGITIDETWSPMIKLSTDDTTVFEEYAKTNVELTKALNSLTNALNALDAGDVTNTSNVQGTNVDDALNTLNTQLSGIIPLDTSPIQHSEKGITSDAIYHIIADVSSGTITKTVSEGTLESVSCVKRGHGVFVSGRIYGMTNNDGSNKQYFQLPEGYRPANTIRPVGYYQKVNSQITEPALFTITSDGKVSLGVGGSGNVALVAFSASFSV